MCNKFVGFELPWNDKGYERGESGYKRIFEIEGDVDNLAAFIASREDYSRFMITDELYKPIIETRGTFIYTCTDKDLLQNNLLPKLIPMQTGEQHIPEVNIIRERSIEEVRIELESAKTETEAEEESELEL